MRPGTQDSRIYHRLAATVFHFRIANTPPASISIHFRKFSARQLSENTIVKRVYYAEICRVGNLEG